MEITVPTNLKRSDRMSGILCGRLKFRAVENCTFLVSYLLDIQNPVQSEVSENVGCSK